MIAADETFDGTWPYEPNRTWHKSSQWAGLGAGQAKEGEK